MEKTLTITDKIHSKLSSLVEDDIHMEALGNILLMDALCNPIKVEWVKNLIRAWDIGGEKDMRDRRL